MLTDKRIKEIAAPFIGFIGDDDKFVEAWEKAIGKVYSPEEELQIIDYLIGTHCVGNVVRGRPAARYTFTIPGRLSGLNEYIAAERTNRYTAAKIKKSEMAHVYHSIGKAPKLRPPVWIDYCFFEPNRRRDKDNIAGWAHKVIQDALIQHHVIENDGWAHIAGWTDYFFVDRKNPRIEVTVKEWESWK